MKFKLSLNCVLLQSSRPIILLFNRAKATEMADWQGSSDQATSLTLLDGWLDPAAVGLLSFILPAFFIPTLAHVSSSPFSQRPCFNLEQGVIQL